MIRAIEIFEMIKNGSIEVLERKVRGSFVFYKVDFRGISETVRVHKTEAI